MNIINEESIEIIMEISRLKKKLLKSVVPEKTIKHLEVIANEVKEILIESIGEDTWDKNKSKLKKVDID
ncbi:hypothetical protein [Helicovermis profundi]|uniref:Uncharacterized protein n=1 Tax=Helicovermis profundi TaxID=3065157 RepID=A0AAU9EET7_9FIRM|nr:hypothetical protein HLPR_15530 [Clostridia bacterium S502]